MDIRDTIHPEHAKALDTEGLRAHFHISGLFAPDAMNMTYTHYDRVIVFGVCPVSGTVEAPNDVSDVTGTDFLLQRREMGIIKAWARSTWTARPTGSHSRKVSISAPAPATSSFRVTMRRIPPSSTAIVRPHTRTI
ncbi:MAG: hypothetical protein AAAB11_13125, partial [Rhizobium giardinii]